MMADALEHAAESSDALATHAEVGETVERLLSPHAAPRQPSTMPPKPSKSWEALGIDESVWRAEAPTSNDFPTAELLAAAGGAL